MINEVTTIEAPAETATGVTKLDPYKIVIFGGTQARDGMSEEAIGEYAEQMRAGVQFPPLVVYYDGEKYWLADGFHRLAAHKKAFIAPGKPGQPYYPPIDTEVKAGTRRDAVLYAAGANASHGLRRTNADKQRAIEVLLKDEEWGNWSDAEIARRVRVDPKTVAARRVILGIPKIEERTVERNGQTYTMNTAAIGQQPRQVWEIQNDMIAWLVMRPADSRLEIALDWQKQRAAAPFWVEMVQSLPKPWRMADLLQAIDSTVAFLQKHDGGLVKAEATAPAAPAVRSTSPHTGRFPNTAEPAHPQQLQNAMYHWLLGRPRVERLEIALGWVAERPDAPHWQEMSATLPSPWRTTDLQKAFEGLIALLRKQLESLPESAASPRPIPTHEIDTPLRNAVHAHIHAGPKADAVIQGVFFDANRPHIATKAIFHPDGREEYEVYELVDLHSYPYPNAIEGAYSGLPVSYVGHSYRLGNPRRFCYQPPAEGADVDPWELLAEKLNALDADTRDFLAEWLSQRLSTPNLQQRPTAAEFLAAVVALLMGAEEEVSA